MTISDNRYVDPTPGGYLTTAQGQRVECLRVALAASAGRSVQMHVIWAIARWLYDNREGP
jgi:hypothetical protein